ncbi:MAG: glycosyltransferase family 4 protein [candidate division Zixibacteria bacterium]|nr:glycosyltransferase family 4 protein [candidate division Zixibacteria bacterium]
MSNSLRNRERSYRFKEANEDRDSTTSQFQIPSRPITRFLLDWPYLKRLTDMILQHDIIHIALSDGMSSVVDACLPALLARFLGKKVILDYHYDKAGFDLDKPGWMTLQLLKSFDKIVVPSPSLTRFLGRYHRDIRTIFEGIDLESIQPRNISSLQPMIIAEQRGKRFINTNSLLKAFRLVKAKYPRAELMIICNTSEKDDIMELAATKHCGGISVIANSPDGTFGQSLARADLYINPCYYDNPLPTMMKALATGLPIVAAASSDGETDVITNGVNGMLFRENDYTALTDRIIELIESPEMVKKLSTNAKLMANRFDWQRIINKWLYVYREL